MTQLCLKQLVLSDQPIHNGVPFSFGNKQGRPTTLSQYAFVRQKNYGNTQRYGVVGWVEGEHLRFEDILAPQGRLVLNGLLASQGVTWHENVIPYFREKHFKSKQDETKLNFDFVIGPGFIAELEDIDERVLYDYKTIMQRKNSIDQEVPIETFLLAQSYDQIRLKGWPDLAQLQTGGRNRPTKVQSEARRFLSCLQEYDEYLINDVGRFRFDLSFNQLTASDEWMEAIAEIFNKDIEAKEHLVTLEMVRSMLKRKYQRLGMFLSTKSKVDVLKLFQGIWYDTENRYLVGSTDSLKNEQARAHLVRQFNIYFGQENFDILPLLDMMAVKFVRHQQFTVYPFPFHLIDLYVENKLRYLE